MRLLLAAIATLALAMAAAPCPARAADYPTKPIRLIAPYPPGGGVDLSARLVADSLSAKLGQQVVVENRPGATGTIGSDYVAKSPADGYTLLWTSTDSITIVPALRPNMAYKVPDDFTFVGKIAETGMSFAVSAKLPVKSISELVAYGKANPGKIRYGSTGVGGSPHLATLMFEKYAGIKMTHIPYKGVAPSLADLLGGHIEFALVTPITIAPYLGSDKIRIIGISAPARHPMLPDAPTVKEAGLPQATSTVWYALFGPAKLPAKVTDRLRKDLAAIAESPELKEKLEKAGLQMSPMMGDAFEKSAVSELKEWKDIGKAENITLE
ncbi:MAG: tripartite tricarboxylate transporter substrate binding protein [Alphaproteobacteria bacterium]|nr:tripartite tricarboxylate transporter substrate binding protein [Alphaproteobacteria bacterium]